MKRIVDRTNACLQSSYGDREIVHARYVVGCDGGHSTVRQQLAFELEGEKTNKHFGVMDIVPLTNFRMFIKALLEIPEANWHQRISATRARYIQMREAS